MQKKKRKKEQTRYYYVFPLLSGIGRFLATTKRIFIGKISIIRDYVVCLKDPSKFYFN